METIQRYIYRYIDLSDTEIAHILLKLKLKMEND